MCFALFFLLQPRQEDIEDLVVGMANGMNSLTTGRERDTIEHGLQQQHDGLDGDRE